MSFMKGKKGKGKKGKGKAKRPFPPKSKKK